MFEYFVFFVYNQSGLILIEDFQVCRNEEKQESIHKIGNIYKVEEENMSFRPAIKLLGLTAFLFLFQACVSTQAYWQKKEYQPKKIAVVYYSPKPSFFDKTAVQQRVQDAKRKMRSFCGSQKVKIISERKAEEVIGRQTHFNSMEDNPNPSYYESVKANEQFYEKSAQMFSKSVLSSSGSQVEQNIIRERIYITFTCE